MPRIMLLQILAACPAPWSPARNVALLIGYGAAAVNPYLAMESVEDLVRSGALPGVTGEKAVRNLIKALGKGDCHSS